MSIEKEVQISRRLLAICQMVTQGNTVVDVGCDHGFVSIYLVQKNLSPRVIAMDVREGPLFRAKEHIELYGLQDYIETRISDGLCAYHIGEATTLICAGMGGRLMQRILTDGQEKAKALEELILQPQSELMEFRRFLRRAGYGILDENILYEEGKYYFLMKAAYAGADEAAHRQSEFNMELADRFGGLLLADKNPVLKEFLGEQLDIQCRIAKSLEGNDSDRAGKKLDAVKLEMEYINQALALY